MAREPCQGGRGCSSCWRPWEMGVLLLDDFLEHSYKGLHRPDCKTLIELSTKSAVGFIFTPKYPAPPSNVLFAKPS